MEKQVLKRIVEEMRKQNQLLVPKSELIKSLLVLAGIPQKTIADRHGFSCSDVSKVIRGKRKTLKIRKAIAEEIGIEYAELWK